MPAISKKNIEAVFALRELFKHTYTPAEGSDALCYRYSVTAASWGKDVVTHKLFAAVNLYRGGTLSKYLHNHRKQEQAFNSGKMAGERD